MTFINKRRKLFTAGVHITEHLRIAMILIIKAVVRAVIE